jgi:hypothetical protein
MICKQGENQELIIKGKAIKGFSIKSYLQHTTANTAFAALEVDYSKVNVKCHLFRNGKWTPLFSDIALPLLAASAFKNGLYEQCVNVGTVAYPKLVAAAAGVKEIVIPSGTIEFDGIVVLNGDDQLKFEIISNTGTFGANVDASASYIQFDEIEGVGNEWFIPTITSKSLRANESSVQFSLGNAVQKIMFINLDKSGILLANRVIAQISVQSDKLRLSDNYNELVSKRYRQFYSVADADARHQSFELAQGVGIAPLNDCNIDIQLDSANVNSGKNYIVVYQFIGDPLTLQRAGQRDARHKQANLHTLAGN